MWDWKFAFSIVPDLLRAMLTAFYATFWGFIIACIFGLVIAVLARSNVRVIRYAIKGIVEFIRNTPLLVQLFFLYYSLPLLTGMAASAFYTGVVGLGLHYSTYLSEVYRSGIAGVPAGQWEAAKALNYTRRQTWLSIVLPQAIPPVVPVMGNYLIVLFKETPMLSAITLVETLLTAKNITSVSYRFFEPYTLVGVLFLVVCLSLSYLVRLLEKRLNRIGGRQPVQKTSVQSKGRSDDEGKREYTGSEVFPG
jgi:polar amino acid transport system permease protein